MSGNEKYDTLRRIVAGGLITAVSVLSLVLACVSLSRGDSQDALVMLLTSLVCLGIVVYFLYHLPIVDMDEEGVHVQVLFKTRSYPWKSFRQVGIITRLERFKHHGRFVLVTEKGTPRGEDDTFFLLRNLGKAIVLPAYNWLVKEYVEEHYGPLDFDDTQYQRDSLLPF